MARIHSPRPPLVQPLQQFPDPAVHIVQPEKLPVTQRGHDPAFNNLYAELDLGPLACLT